MQQESMLKGVRNTLLGTDREFWVSHEHRLIFLSIPKNANSFLRAIFVKNHARGYDFDPGAESILEYHRRAGRRHVALSPRQVAAYPDYRRLVVLRDPFARLVSAYLDKLVKPIVDPERREPATRYFQQLSRHQGESIDADTLTFRRFLDHAADTSEQRRNKHCRSQSHYIGDQDFSFYGDMADMPAVLDYLAGCGLDVTMPQKSWHKRTAYVTESPDASRDPADMTPRELAALDGFPSPAAFFDPALCQRFQAGYAEDIALYARHTEQRPEQLTARYGG